MSSASSAARAPQSTSGMTGLCAFETFEATSPVDVKRTYVDNSPDAGLLQPILPSSFHALRQALWIVELLELLLGGADAQAKSAKTLALDILLACPRKYFAVVEPYLQDLFAVLGDEVDLCALSILGATEKSIACGSKKPIELVSAFLWDLIALLNSPLEF